MQLIFDGVLVVFLKEDAALIETQMAELERFQEGRIERPSVFEPSMAQRYRREVKKLIEALNGDGHREEASELVRSLIHRIVLTPSEERDRPIIDLEGDLAGIMAIAAERSRREVEADLSEFDPARSGALSAGKPTQHHPASGRTSNLRASRGTQVSDKLGDLGLAPAECEALVAGVCNHLNLADGSEAKVSAKNQGFDLLFNAYDITDVHLRSRTA